jgi:hypothetical protein
VQAPALRRNSRNPTTPTEKIDSIYDHYDKSSFRFWEREISEGRLPTSAELADLVEANSDGAIPAWLIPIIVQGLRGKLKQPAGRLPATVLQNMFLQVAIAQYPHYLAWLKAREKRSGLTGWSLIRESDWWVGPPHERAARIVTARWLQHMDWRSFLNRIPSRKPGRSFCE